MSRLKLIGATAASIITGAVGGIWWERNGRREQQHRRFDSSNHDIRNFLPSVCASTIPPPPPPLPPLPVTFPPVSGGGDAVGLNPPKKPPLSLGQPPSPQPSPLPKRSSQMMKFGYPTLDQLKWRNDYVLSYDRRNKTAYWVFEHLTADSCKRRDGVERKKCNFKCDPSVHSFFQSSDCDYKHSGFDRGHLAAAGNHRSSLEDCQETFYYSNMAPQVGEGFNRGAWNQLEKMMRNFAKRNPNVYVVTGPLYLPRQETDGKMYVKYQVIGRNQVSVPTHFFKVAVIQTPSGALEVHSFVLPNRAIPDSVPLTSFYVPLESIERSAGFFLFEKIPRDSFEKINGIETTNKTTIPMVGLPAIGG